MAYEKEDGTRVESGEWYVFVVYEFIVVSDDGIVYEAYETADEARRAARVWLIEEMGGTDFEVSEVDAMTDEQVEDAILDYDHISFRDVAHRRILFG
jgi:hypothetical protein